MEIKFSEREVEDIVKAHVNSICAGDWRGAVVTFDCGYGYVRNVTVRQAVLEPEGDEE